MKYRRKYQEINIPSILNTDIFIYNPTVKLKINKSTKNGDHPSILDNKKKSFTTPLGKRYEIINPNDELIKAPHKIINKIK